MTNQRSYIHCENKLPETDAKFSLRYKEFISRNIFITMNDGVANSTDPMMATQVGSVTYMLLDFARYH